MRLQTSAILCSSARSDILQPRILHCGEKRRSLRLLSLQLLHVFLHAILPLAALWQTDRLNRVQGSGSVQHVLQHLLRTYHMLARALGTFHDAEPAMKCSGEEPRLESSGRQLHLELEASL